VQMHVLVRVGMIQRQAGGGKSRELRADFRRQLSAHMRIEKITNPQSQLVGGKPASRVHKIRDLRVRQNRGALDHHQMQPHMQTRHRLRPPHGIGECRRADHQAGVGENSLAVRALDAFVDNGRKSEIIGADNNPLQAWRSRRNWKNSTPSRNRRFIICGLRTISLTMEAIFGARK